MGRGEVEGDIDNQDIWYHGQGQFSGGPHLRFPVLFLCGVDKGKGVFVGRLDCDQGGSEQVGWTAGGCSAAY